MVLSRGVAWWNFQWGRDSGSRVTYEGQKQKQEDLLRGYCNSPGKQCWVLEFRKLVGLDKKRWICKNVKDKNQWRTSLVAQWLRIRLPMQGTRVRALVREDPTCCGATKPVRHNYWACTPQLLKPARSRARTVQLLSPGGTTTKAHVPRACAPQQEKPPQWEAHAPQQRVVPARRN